MTIEWLEDRIFGNTKIGPTIRISDDGMIKLNKISIELLENPKYVCCGYDKETHSLALKASDKEGIGARKLSRIGKKKTVYATISARIFLSRFGLFGIDAVTVKANLQDGILMAKLPENKALKAVGESS